jgi:hypothetical protein
MWTVMMAQLTTTKEFGRAFFGFTTGGFGADIPQQPRKGWHRVCIFSFFDEKVLDRYDENEGAFQADPTNFVDDQTIIHSQPLKLTT